MRDINSVSKGDVRKQVQIQSRAEKLEFNTVTLSVRP